MSKPSGFTRLANKLAPFIEPPPGILLTTIAGLPGICFWKNGALNRAQVSPPPPSLKGMTNSIVLPAK